ncbi:MAG: hypothetical protein ACPIOQ_52975, partial [Promethearchaeia archaeon]
MMSEVDRGGVDARMSGGAGDRGQRPLAITGLHGADDSDDDDENSVGAQRVLARLGGDNFSAQCRCCSYCGSCFSGRFMKPNAMHQQAGGWKEITERTAAGKFSWAS